MARIIGIRHRVKATAEGEARPTQVVIDIDEPDRSGRVVYDLADEQAELDFLLGNFSISWRKLEIGEEVGNNIPDSHLKHKKPKNDEDEQATAIYRVINGEERVVTHVASEFDGLKNGDRVAMVLGGSGDYFAFALAKRAEAIEAQVFRIPSAKLKELRGEAEKDDDARLLAVSLKAHAGLFYEFRSRDAELIRIREAYFARIDAMKARIACEQRLRQVVIGKIFCNPDGHFPEGAIEKIYDEAKANDAIYTALEAEEKRRNAELKKLVENSEVWKFLGEVEGLGWAIVSRIISSVVDIRRFFVSADKGALDGSYRASATYAKKGHWDEDASHVAHITDRWLQTGAMVKWKNEHGKTDDASYIQMMLDEFAARSDIRRRAKRSMTARFKAFAGVHVLEDGTFVRRRRGQVANWHPDLRQALFLLGDQMNKRPGSYWGQKLRKNKELLRQVHPEMIIVEGKKRYTDGHIHKMAIWRTLTQFAMWLFREWERFDTDPAHFALRQEYNEPLPPPLEQAA